MVKKGQEPQQEEGQSQPQKQAQNDSMQEIKILQEGIASIRKDVSELTSAMTNLWKKQKQNENQANAELLQEIDEQSSEEGPPAGILTQAFSNPLYHRSSEKKKNAVVMAPKITYYDGDDNPETWLRMFKRSMKKQDIMEAEYLEEIPFWLKGKASNWYEQNEESFKGKFNKFQAKFLEKYHKSMEVYESKLLTTKQRSNQTLEEYLLLLQKIAKPAKLPEQKLKIAFIEGLLNKEMRRYARQQYLFQTNEGDMDKILFALQEYEYDSKNQVPQKSFQGSTGYNRQEYNKQDYNKNKTQSDKNDRNQAKVIKGKKLNMIGEESETEDNILVQEIIKDESESDNEEQAAINMVEHVNISDKVGGFGYSDLTIDECWELEKQMDKINNPPSIVDIEKQVKRAARKQIEAQRQRRRIRKRFVRNMLNRIFESVIEKNDDEPIGLNALSMYKAFTLENKQKDLQQRLWKILKRFKEKRQTKYARLQKILKKRKLTQIAYIQDKKRKIIEEVNFRLNQQSNQSERFSSTTKVKSEPMSGEINMIDGINTILIRKVYMRIIKNLPLTNIGNRHMVVTYDGNGTLLMIGPIDQLNRWRLIEWIRNQFFQWYHPLIIETLSERWFQGSFESFLYINNIIHERVFYDTGEIQNMTENIDSMARTIYLEGGQWDQYRYVQQEQSNLIGAINSIESEERQEINQIRSGDLHNQLVKKVKQAKYIPAKTAKTFAENTLANMSLGQVLESSPIIRNDWYKYIKECEALYVEKVKTQTNQSQQAQVNQIGIPVLKNIGFDYIPCKVMDKNAKGMIDTGANISVVSERFVKENNLQDQVTSLNTSIKLASGKSDSMTGVIKDAVVSLKDDTYIVVDLTVTKANSYDIIIGRNIQRTIGLQILSDGVKYQSTKTQKEILIPYTSSQQINSLSNIQQEEDLAVLITDVGDTMLEVSKLYPLFPNKQDYDLILMDPPWQYDIHTIPSLAPPYKTLTMGQLKMLPVKNIARENSILLMWSTGPMLPQAIQLMAEYGFTYRTILFTWIKTNSKGEPYMGRGNYTNPCTELLLIGTKGKIRHMLNNESQVSQCFMSPINKHSQKPKEIFDKIKQLFNIKKTKNLEIFSRCQRDYFDAYGNEFPNYYQKVNHTEKVETGVYTIQEASQDEKSTDQMINEIPIGIAQENVSINKRLWTLMKKFKDIFATKLFEIGQTNVAQHKISIQKDSKPLQQSPYRISKMEMDFVRDEIKDLLKAGLIREEVSNWASPIVLVKKQNGKLRMCVDYRKLNAVTIDEKFPIPRIDDIFAQLQGAIIFSKLDFKSGFWQIPIAEDSQQLTSFITPDGQYVWQRMPFGLKNAPSTFQRCMMKVLGKALRKFIMVYIDDVIIFSKSLEDHLDHLEWVFDQVRAADLRLGPDKCTLFQTTIDLLGHTITNNQIFPMKQKVEAIQKLVPPTNRTGVRSFLGLTGYYRQFIPNYSKIAQPLFKISGDKSEWQWTQDQETAFQKLKLALMENPILNLCMDDKPFILYTDFSIQGLGAVLTQMVNNKKEMVIEFASRTLTSYERNLDAYQGEVLGVYWALTRFRHYLLGRRFTLVTDNKALEWVLKLNNPSRKINRWLIEILEYDFEIKHRKGINHNNADALSRLIAQTKEGEVGMLSNIFYLEDIGDIACIKCQSKQNADKMLLCDLCGDAWHTFCHIPNIKEIPKGPWYCTKCLTNIPKIEKKDITIDFQTIQYLQTDQLASDMDIIEKNRIMRRAQQYIVRDDRVYYRSKSGLKLVPTISERPILIKECHSIVGHQAMQKTIHQIQLNYTWYNIHQDVSQFIKNCSTCNATNPRFSISAEYFPTEKGTKPFEVIAMDLITGLPKTQKGNQHIIVAIDAFSKFIELRAIPNKRSETITDFVIEEILCRYGCPAIIRTDQGKEFLGSLTPLLDEYYIKHKKISQGYPQANSQAERTVQTVERILRKFLISNYNTLEWDDIIPFVMRSMRTAVSNSTKYSPYEVLYGTPMKIPDAIALSLLDYQEKEISDQEIANYTKNLIKHLAHINNQVIENLRNEDERQTHAHETSKKFQDKKIIFLPGQLVYLKKMRFNKTESPVAGPYQFVRYIGSKGAVEIIDPANGKIRSQNSNQLAPVMQIPIREHALD